LTSLYSPGTDHTENVSSIIACSLISGETCPQTCSLATAVVLSPVYAAVTWRWVYMKVCELKYTVLGRRFTIICPCYSWKMALNIDLNLSVDNMYRTRKECGRNQGKLRVRVLT
jgi:hypothetical protein